MRVVIVSGGFDPIHSGHINHFIEAKKLGDILIVGLNSDDETAAVIGGLVNNTSYFVHSATTNTFKLSESHSNCGDAAAVSLTGLSSDGTKQTFISQGKSGKGETWPDNSMPKYDGA